MKKFAIILAVFIALLFSASVVSAQRRLDRGNGWPRYVETVVSWDGDLTDVDSDGNTDSSSWTVYGPLLDPVIDPANILVTCSDCLDMSTYSFDFKGKTLKFEETYVSGVDAYPQTHKVVLHDQDGDGTYTGSITARYDFPSEIGEWIRMDVIEYRVDVDENNNITNFYYEEHQYKKNILE